MKTVRWGLLSTANINRRLIPAIRASQRGELVAIASRSLESAEAYASEWGIPQAFGSYQSMLDSGQIDVVYISLPNHLHAEWSIRAMHAGVHVLCEKPFAITLEEVDRMIAAHEETNMMLAEAFMYRHHPQTKIVGDIVRNGRIGEVSTIWGVFNFSIGSRENVRLVPEWGGGALWDVGVYPMSFAQFIYGGPPKSVAGMQWTGDSGVDESFVGQLRYPGGRLAQIACAFRSPFHTYIEIIGSDGRVTLNRPFTGMEQGQGVIKLYIGDEEPAIISAPEKELYLGEVEDMHNAIIDGDPPYITLRETRNHIRTILALYESARIGNFVNL